MNTAGRGQAEQGNTPTASPLPIFSFSIQPDTAPTQTGKREPESQQAGQNSPKESQQYRPNEPDNYHYHLYHFCPKQAKPAGQYEPEQHEPASLYFSFWNVRFKDVRNALNHYRTGKRLRQERQAVIRNGQLTPASPKQASFKFWLGMKHQRPLYVLTEIQQDVRAWETARKAQAKTASHLLDCQHELTFLLQQDNTTESDKSRIIYLKGEIYGEKWKAKQEAKEAEQYRQFKAIWENRQPSPPEENNEPESPTASPTGQASQPDRKGKLNAPNASEGNEPTPAGNASIKTISKTPTPKKAQR